MDITFNQYISNPMGKNNAIMSSSSREFMKMRYKKKFDNLMLRENGKIEFHLYTAPNNVYWIYVKIPSEVVKKFYYDVLIKFTATEKVKSGGKDLFEYNVQFFSNDPAFVYTYAYIFSKNNLFIKELSSKMTKVALKKAPKEKNPSESVGYVKSLYFVYLLMQNRSLNKVGIFEKQANPINIPFLLSNIEDADKKIDERQELGAKISQRKKVELDKDTLKKVQGFSGGLSDSARERITVRTTKTVGKIRNTSNIKATKKTTRKS